ncbi:MAG: GNAT family N-acetyltransferase [Armatimonadota bacterium]
MIRLATDDDAPFIAEFYYDIRQDSVLSIHDVGSIEWYITNRLIKRGSSYVYTKNGEIVGWVDVHEGCLDQLYCRRGHTGNGIGVQLLNFAKEKSPTGLQLWTFQVNQGARRFYTREGFVEVELTDGQANEEKQPDVRMEWRP